MTAAERRFDHLARHAAPRLLGYATRRVDAAADAADVVAEVLLIAWRRIDRVPADDDEAVLWLFAVARRVLANHRRGRVRRNALAERLRRELAVAPSIDERRDLSAVRDALQELSAAERELITLHAWEGLTIAEAARVLGIRPATARKRLERARRKLAEDLSSFDALPAYAVHVAPP